LLIPILGPFVSAGVYRDAAWSLPWAFVDGATQVAGLAMLIAGVKDRHKVPVLVAGVKIAPYASPAGGGLVASGRF
jgi:hypothetical protein